MCSIICASTGATVEKCNPSTAAYEDGRTSDSFTTPQDDSRNEISIQLFQNDAINHATVTSATLVTKASVDVIATVNEAPATVNHAPVAINGVSVNLATDNDELTNMSIMNNESSLTSAAINQSNLVNDATASDSLNINLTSDDNRLGNLLTDNCASATSFTFIYTLFINLTKLTLHKIDTLSRMSSRLWKFFNDLQLTVITAS